ncbi:adenosylcobinamide-GDP ribazoletransferase [Candidatus Bathyarchaeota archaeon]|nr:adenosylcobinamide-GDP ribazoletransferase [Candidatus Bathyarchaeota archaeon]
MFKEIKSLIAFLTIIPVGMDSECLTDAADYMSLFPLVGAFIGLLAGIFAWLLLTILDALIVGILTLGFILLITGLHHTDGLLDFGDGIMYQGSPEKKIEIMHDQQTGAGGLALGLVAILTTAFCIAQLSQNFIVQSLIVCEASAKLAMVLMAWVGRSAHEGMNTYFVNAMHGKHRYIRLVAALFIAFSIALLLLHIAGFTAIIAGLVAALVIVGISNRHFRGVTGDVFGAGNEFARLSSLIAILVVVRWL